MTESCLFRSNHTSSNLQILLSPLSSGIEIIVSSIFWEKQRVWVSRHMSFSVSLACSPLVKKRMRVGADLQFQSNNVALHLYTTIHRSMAHQNVSYFKQFNEITNRKPERKISFSWRKQEQNQNPSEAAITVKQDKMKNSDVKLSSQTLYESFV